MNNDYKLREVKKRQREGFVLGFLGGSGLMSAILLVFYNALRSSDKTDYMEINNKTDKGPESFEIIDK